VGGLFVIAGLSWWLWPREELPVTPSGLSAQVNGQSRVGDQEKPGQDARSRKPSAPKPATKDVAPAALPEQKLPPADPLAKARQRTVALRKAGDDEALRRHLGKFVLDRRLERDERVAMLAELDKLSDRLVWSATPGPAFLTVKVQPGDNYWDLARRLRKEGKTTATAGMLRAINNIDPARLRLGQALKIPREAVSVLVDKSDFTLYVLLGGVYVRQYPVGIGKDGSTPEGTFQIGGKTAKPTWRDPKTGKRFRYGEEGHLIGSRWMGFLSDGAGTGYGIHGTVEPDTIGRAASEGCIRLVNADVEALFELVPEGATVTVRP